MFVEIARLLIVLLATGTGYGVARSTAGDGSPRVVVGAVLGALFGYVIGGVVARLLRRGMGRVEATVERTPPAQLLGGGFGAALLGGLSLLLGIPAVVLMPGLSGWPVLGLLVWIGLYEGFRIGARKSEELLAMAGLSTRPLVRASRYGGNVAPDALLVDSSAAIDGRLLNITTAGFLRGALLVPRFVLDELQGIADAAEPTRRRRGRRGLEILDSLQGDPRVSLHIVDDEVPEFDEVDAKLVALARRLDVGLLTTDFNLQRVAELQGVSVLNLNRLAESMRPVHVPGEVVRFTVSRPGKEAGQGVGFLDDGTMVVVSGAAELVGQEIAPRVTSNVQTSVGRMLFASLDPSALADTADAGGEVAPTG
ncbi:MAG: hypothetical protein JO086_04675 [Acidimicrobiia bacterium]|nr:hypothetical protein [Acidimicrobiia bacterium]